MNCWTTAGCIALALALLVGCDTSGSGDEFGNFPARATGPASDVVGCGAFDLDDNDTLSIDLMGSKIKVSVDLDRDCEAEYSGTGSMKLSDTAALAFNFSISADDDCDDIEDIDYTSLAQVDALLLSSDGESLKCVNAVGDDSVPVLACNIAPACAFKVVNPKIEIFFDIRKVVEDAAEEALDDLIFSDTKDLALDTETGEPVGIGVRTPADY